MGPMNNGSIVEAVLKCGALRTRDIHNLLYFYFYYIHQWRNGDPSFVRFDTIPVGFQARVTLR